MDEADISDARAEIEQRLRDKFRVETEIPQGHGVCLYCGEPIGPGPRWCKAAHRDAWEQDQRRQTRR